MSLFWLLLLVSTVNVLLGYALAAFLGGTFHGFVIRSLWNVTVLSIGASGAFMVAGVLASSINKQDESRRWLWAGVAVSLSSFAVQLTGFRRGLDFNHNDLFHVMQIVAQYFFFRGAALLKDR